MKRRIYLVLLFLPLLICLLTGCGNPSALSSSTVSSTTVMPAQAATGKFKEFALPQNNDGLMRPTIDMRGRIWFGEMNRNYLGSFDPRTGKFWQQTPPRGKWGIMGAVAAPDNTIWFAEQYA